MSTTVSSLAYDREAGKIFLSLNSSGIYSSVPGTGKWVQDASGIPYWVSSIDQLFVDSNGKVGAVTNAEIYLYNDAISTWETVAPAISSDSITTAVFDPNGRTYAGTGSDGLYFLDNSALSWIQCGITPAPIISLAIDQTYNLYAGTDVGVLEKGKGSARWSNISNGLTEANVYQIRWSNSKKILYAATDDGFYYLPATGNYQIPLVKQWTYDFAETPTYVYIGTPGGIFESYGGQDMWLPLQSVGLPLTSIYCLTLDASGDLFAGTMYDGVFESTDGGTLWTEMGVTSPIIFNSVKALKIGYNGRMFAGTDTSGAYFSDDLGTTWTKIPSIAGNSVTCFNVDFYSRYFAGTLDRGIFMSTDQGLTWEQANAGLTDSNVTALLLDQEGYLYAATDSGLFRSNSIVTAIHQTEPVIKSYYLSQNYPNPFNPTTVISYRLSAISHVSLKVHDVLGREVKTLVNGVQMPGNYEVRFDGSRFASGVYSYVLRAGSFVSTRKMVLCK